jgi:phosphoglycolate phosphatase
MIRCALEETGASAGDDQAQRLFERLVAHYEEHIAVKTRFFPGFLDAAHDLRRRGARLALCTNKRENLTERLLAALGAGALFHAAAGRDTFPFHKPDPRHITELVARAGGDLRFSIMVGDSEADVAAARGAGIPVLAVRHGYANPSPEELGADAILERFEELSRLVEARLRLTTEIAY